MELRRPSLWILTLLAAGVAQHAAETQTESAAPQPTAALQAILDEGDRLLAEDKPEDTLAAAERAVTAAVQASDLAGRAHAERLRARCLEALGHTEEALVAWREAGRLWEAVAASPEVVEALCAQALLMGGGDPADALRLVEGAVALASGEKSRPLAAASALNAAAERAGRTDRLEAAGRLAGGALAIYEEKIPGSLDVARSVESLGIVAHDRGDLDAAMHYHERALSIREKLVPGSLDIARSLNNLGIVASSRGDLDTARDYHERALAIRERIAPGSGDVAQSIANLANVAVFEGDLDAARDQFGRSLAIREKLVPGSLDVAVSLNGLGAVALYRGDLDAARDYFERALAIQEKLAPGSLHVARSLNNLGMVSDETGDLHASRILYQRALAIVEQLAPGSLEFPICLNNMGASAAKQSDLSAARDYFERALAIYEKLAPGSFDVAMSLHNLGSVAGDLGDMDAARTYFERAMVVAEKASPGSMLTPAILHNLGNISRDDPEAARDYQERALGIYEELTPGSLDVADCLHALGILASERGDQDAARGYLERSLAIGEKLAPGSLRVARTLNSLGNVALDGGRQAAAEDYLARAWRIVRSQRRGVAGDEAGRAFGATYAICAADLMRARLTRNDTFAALEALEESRAQGLLQLMSERGLAQARVDPDLWRRYQAAEAAWIRAGNDLAAAGAEEARVEREVPVRPDAAEGRAAAEAAQEQLSHVREQRQAALSVYTRTRLESERLLGQVRGSVPGLEPRAFSIEEARRALPEGSVFLAWLVGKNESSLFIIPADARRPVEAHRIGLGEEQLTRQVAALRQRIGAGRSVRGIGGLSPARQPDHADDSLVLASHDLFESIFPAAAREAVRKADRVILSPDGPLWELPFAALSTKSSGRPGWLGLHKRLSYTPSLTVLTLEHERARPEELAGRPALVVGDPLLVGAARTTGLAAAATTRALPAVAGERSALLPGGEMPERLPAGAEEARRVAALYGTVPLLGEAATEAAVRRRISGAGVIHFATHGYFHPSLAMSSGILLAVSEAEPGPTDDDGVLQAWEFGSSLPLRADLVVLSACETGRGERVQGEGLVGLTRALIAAGARSVVATQWKIADESTASLMVSFHERLQGGLPKDEALRRALAETAARPQTSHPYYWAAFFLTGDPDSPIAPLRRP